MVIEETVSRSSVTFIKITYITIKTSVLLVYNLLLTGIVTIASRNAIKSHRCEEGEEHQ